MCANFIQDIYLTEFFDRKMKNVEVIGIQELIVMNQCFSNKKINIPCIQKRIENNLSTSTPSALETYITNKLPILLNILTSCRGKLSICGIHAIPFETMEDTCYFLLYFDSCTIDEAKEMLTGCIPPDTYLTYIQHKGITYLQLDPDIYYIIICLTIFHDKNHLLRSIGSGLERHGWNPITGYFTTLSGAICAVTQTYLIELNTSIINLHRFCINLDVAFPGLTKFNEDDTLVTQEGTIIHCKTLGGPAIDYSSPINNRNVPYNTTWDIIVDLANRDTNISYISFNIIRSSFFSYAEEVVLISARNRFSKDYKLTQLGIDDDRYVALNNCTKYFNIPKEIFLLICSYWFIAENRDAKHRLLTGLY